MKTTDVLIIGSGIAGASAALKLAQNPRRKIILLTREADLKTAINSLLSPLEVAALRRRAAALLADRCYPTPKPGERNFPWPPV